jgi:hypothetical protein
VKTWTQQLAATFGDALEQCKAPGERFGFDIVPVVRGGVYGHVIVMTMPSPLLGEDLVAIAQLGKFTLTPAAAAKIAGELATQMRHKAREQLAAAKASGYPG